MVDPSEYVYDGVAVDEKLVSIVSNKYKNINSIPQQYCTSSIKIIFIVGSDYNIVYRALRSYVIVLVSIRLMLSLASLTLLFRSQF